MDVDNLSVREIRKLVIDCCRQNGGGHGGSAIGMTPIAVALWKYILNYNPKNPSWFNRDRFILSNGHVAILLYIMLHVTGYESWSMKELRGYGGPEFINDPNTETICHGHPEIDYDGIEVTTGPLGQGIANAVGMAIAVKNLAARYNESDLSVISSKIYCTVGDGCIQEGVALEAIALAGHLGLDSLIVIYDNNQVTCDGPVDWIASDDVNNKFQSMGWRTIDVFEGDTSVEDIVIALKLAKSYVDKPTLINVRTTIGYKTKKAGSSAAHHGTFDDEDVTGLLGEEGLKRSTHSIDQLVLDDFKNCTIKGEKLENDWELLLERYEKQYPDKAISFKKLINGDMFDYKKTLDNIEASPSLPTRTINGIIFKQLLDNYEQIFAGGADLWASNHLGEHEVFDRNNFINRVCRYGVREHAMCSISNGIAAFNKGSFIPLTATYFMFYLYGAAGIRMGALSKLQVIHMATHDSISEGQNGPTHQPIELATLFRSMPDLLYIRPSDSEEVIGAWDLILSNRSKSSIISLARDENKYIIPNTNRDKVKLGGYIVLELEGKSPGPLISLVGTGSELQFAVEAANILFKEYKLNIRVISMPCLELFQKQPDKYKLEILGEDSIIISVEPYVSTIWAQICNASIGMNDWGHSGSPTSNYERYEFTPNSIAKRVYNYINKDKGLRRFWESI